jgi:hypothetical protein
LAHRAETEATPALVGLQGDEWQRARDALTAAKANYHACYEALEDHDESHRCVIRWDDLE